MQKGSAAPSPSPADGPNVLLRVITGTRTGEGGGLPLASHWVSRSGHSHLPGGRNQRP